jgi:phosphoribosylglycinamide formyltransferase-1
MSNSGALRVVVLISGSGTNLQAIIDAQHAGKINTQIIAVISDRSAAYGLTRATEAGIEALTLDYKSFASKAEYETRLAETLTTLNPELVVLAGYMRILPDSIVNDYADRMLNVHPALLPAYPGLNTYARVLEAGETWHGTTVHFVIPELDAGPGILQYRVRIHDSETEPQLQERVQQGEYMIYPQAIGWFADNRLEFNNGEVLLDGQKLITPVVIDEVEA